MNLCLQVTNENVKKFTGAIKCVLERICDGQLDPVFECLEPLKEAVQDVGSVVKDASENAAPTGSPTLTNSQAPALGLTHTQSPTLVEEQTKDKGSKPGVPGLMAGLLPGQAGDLLSPSGLAKAASDAICPQLAT